MRRNSGWLGILGVTVVLAAALLVAVGPAFAQGQGLERKIVIFQARVVNQPAQAALVRAVGGVAEKPLPLLNGWAVSLPPQAVPALAKRAEVVRIDDDLEIHAVGVDSAGRGGKPQPPPPPVLTPQVLPWGVERVGAPAVWGTNTGVGIKVAIMDTGIDSDHPDLHVHAGYNAIRPRSSWNDDNGHGTHVAGIVAALNNTAGVVGVAPGVDLYAVKALNRQGSGALVRPDCRAYLVHRSADAGGEHVAGGFQRQPVLPRRHRARGQP